jgi:hypothetical protein
VSWYEWRDLNDPDEPHVVLTGGPVRVDTTGPDPDPDPDPHQWPVGFVREYAATEQRSDETQEFIEATQPARDRAMAIASHALDVALAELDPDVWGDQA